MDWELFKKRPFVRKFGEYDDETCVLITESKIYFTGRFCKTFGFLPKTGILTHHSPRANMAGFEICVISEQQNAAYKLVCCGRTSFIHAVAYIKKKLKPEHYGKIFEASMAPGSKIISIDLGKPLN